LLDRLEKHIAEDDLAIAWHLVKHRGLVLLSCPYVNFISASEYLAHRGPLANYPSVRKIFGFAGAYPYQHQSGQLDARGGIIKWGNSGLRYALGMFGNQLLKNPYFAQALPPADDEEERKKQLSKRRWRVVQKALRVFTLMEAQGKLFEPPTWKGKPLKTDDPIAKLKDALWNRVEDRTELLSLLKTAEHTLQQMGLTKPTVSKTPKKPTSSRPSRKPKTPWRNESHARDQADRPIDDSEITNCKKQTTQEQAVPLTCQRPSNGRCGARQQLEAFVQLHAIGGRGPLQKVCQGSQVKFERAGAPRSSCKKLSDVLPLAVAHILRATAHSPTPTESDTTRSENNDVKQFER